MKPHMTQRHEHWTEAETTAVHGCLDKILASPMFAQAERQQRFLKFIVTETLAGRAEQLKGYTVGVEVFDRAPGFDPILDSIVRVEAARLRAKLREYYDGEGRADPIRFELPKGAYAPVIHIQTAPEIPPLTKGGEATRRGDLDRLAAIEDKPSLAVLPFTNMSADPEQEYFADGITDGLITDLSKLSGLLVISRHSSFVYKDMPKRAEEIGRELGVKYLLEGSVQRSDDRVRINVQLIDAASGAHLWAERYDHDLKDIFSVQDDVTRRVVAALKVKLTGSETERLGRGGTTSVEAHDCLLRGLERFWMYTDESEDEARKLFARAVELDPGYASAHAWLARVLVCNYWCQYRTQPPMLDDAFEHARIAVKLDEHLPLAQAVLGWVQLWRKQSEASLAAGQRAVALDPNNADAHVFLALSLAAVGRAEEALRYIEKGMRLSPHPSAFYQWALGHCYFVLEDYDKALAALRRGAELRRTFVCNQVYLCLIYTLLGREEEARVQRDEVLELTEGRTPVLREMFLDHDLLERYRGLIQLAGLQ